MGARQAGASITGAVVRKRLENIRAFTSVDGFVTQIVDVIEPLTDEQMEAIEPLIQEAGEEIEVVIGLTGLEIYLVIDGMETKLEPYLTQEQLQRLKARRKEVRERFRTRQNAE